MGCIPTYAASIGLVRIYPLAVDEYHYDDVWDDWGNLTRIVQDVGTGHLNRTTLMKYDVAGNVTERTAPDGSKTVIEYNVLRQLATE